MLCSLGISNSLKRSPVFPILLFSSIFFFCIVHLRRPSHHFLLFSGTPLFFNQLFVKPPCGSGSHSVVSDSLWPHGLYSPWNSLGQNTGVCSLSLLEGIFSTQGLNPGVSHCGQILYQLRHKRSLLRKPFFLYKKHFFFLGTALVTTSCGVTNVMKLCPVLHALCLPDLIPWIYWSPPLYNPKGFDLGHIWVV